MADERLPTLRDGFYTAVGPNDGYALSVAADYSPLAGWSVLVTEHTAHTPGRTMLGSRDEAVAQVELLVDVLQQRGFTSTYHPPVTEATANIRESNAASRAAGSAPGPEGADGSSGPSNSMRAQAPPANDGRPAIDLTAPTFEQSGLPDTSRWRENFAIEKERQAWYANTFVPSANLGAVASGVVQRTDGVHYVGERFWQETKEEFRSRAEERARDDDPAGSALWLSASAVFPGSLGEVIVPGGALGEGAFLGRFGAHITTSATTTAAPAFLQAMALTLRQAIANVGKDGSVDALRVVAKLWHPISERMRTIALLQTDKGLWYGVRGGPPDARQRFIFEILLGARYADLVDLHAEQQVLRRAMEMGEEPLHLLISKAACGKPGHDCARVVVDGMTNLGYVAERFDGFSAAFRKIVKGD